MLDTIPLKRKSYKTRKHAAHIGNMHTNTPLHQAKRKIQWWQVVILVLAIAIAGITILRFSRASTAEVIGIPQNITDIQNYVSSLSVKNTQPLQLPMSKYVEFRYEPTSSEQISVVAYYIDGNKVYDTSSQPYHATLDTERLSNGNHNLTAIAFNAGGVPVAAIERTIVVNHTIDTLGNIKNIITYPLNRFFNL